MPAVAVHPEPVSAPPPPTQEHVVLPPLRRDLIVTQQVYEGRSYFVVKDPVSLQYFRMTAEDYYLATLFDGSRTFGQIRDLYLAHFPHVRLEYSQDDLNERVLRFANDLALLQFLSVQGMRLKARYEAVKKKKTSKGGLYNLANKIFFFRFSLVDPDIVFGKMAKKVWWLWTVPAHWISCALVLAAAVVFLRNHGAVESAMGNLFSLRNIALMWITTIFIKSIHELGHGLTCKHFGGEVHEVGFMSMVFTPYFFVNISDAWVMPRRRDRILISAAGIYVELIFAALAVFLWVIVQPGALKDFLFNIIFIASISTLMFNANPLMRFDGYYILTDLIEVPNLQTKSRALISYQVKRLLFGGIPTDAVLSRMPLPKRRLGFFYVYAILSWLYGYYVIYQLAIFMEPHLKPFGLEGLANWFSALALISWVLMPLIAFYKGLALTRDDWRPQGRLRRLSLILGVTLGIFGAACFLPVDFTIKRIGAVELSKPEQIRPKVTGFIEKVFVKEGDRVTAGQPLAQLHNRDLNQNYLSTENRLRVAEAMVQRAVGLDRPAELKQTEINRASHAAKLEEARRDVESLTLRASVDGVVLTRNLAHAEGRLIRYGELLCELAPLDPMRIKIPLSEKQVHSVKKGQRVLIKVNAYPAEQFEGVIAEDPVMFYGEEIPKAFSARRTGDVPTYTDAKGREVPLERTFEAVVEVDNSAGLLRPGMTGRGKIYAGRRPWGQLVLQTLRDLISLDFRF